MVRIAHLEQAAILMILTTAIMGYAYAMELFIAWYGGDVFERQFAMWRMTGGYAWLYWLMWFCNAIAPFAFLNKWVRTREVPLWIVSFLVLLGMWVERWVLIVTATAHDFMPENWSAYHPTWVEVSISLASLCWFLFWFLLYSKHVPTVSIAESKEPQVSYALEAAG